MRARSPILQNQEICLVLKIVLVFFPHNTQYKMFGLATRHQECVYIAIKNLQLACESQFRLVGLRLQDCFIVV